MHRGIPQIGARAIQPLMSGLRAHGVDLAAFLTELGIDPRVATDPDQRIPLALLDDLWHRAAEEMRDRDFGLHAAEAVTAGTFGILSYLGISSPTWKDGLERVNKYFRLLSDASTYQLEVEGTEARITAVHLVPGGAHIRQRIEFTVAVICCYGRKFIDGDWTVSDVFFEHPEPLDTREHLRVFGCAPRFGRPRSGFSFPAALLDRPLKSGDADLCGILEQQAQRMLDDTSRPLTFADALRAALLTAGFGADLSLEAAARRMGMSERTLQRRLREEGTSHAAVADEVRRSMAMHMLARPDVGIGEIAFALGFSEPASFHRAFKRWTGTTPAEFRRTVQRD